MSDSHVVKGLLRILGGFYKHTPPTRRSFNSHVVSSVHLLDLLKFAAASLKAIIRHIGAVHSSDPNFQVTCGINEYPRTYKCFHSFRRHFYLDHHHSSVEVSQTIETDADSLINVDDNASDNDFSVNSTAATHSDMKRQAALFLLKAREVSQTALEGLLSEIEILFNQYMISQQTEMETASFSKDFILSISDLGLAVSTISMISFH